MTITWEEKKNDPPLQRTRPYLHLSFHLVWLYCIAKSQIDSIFWIVWRIYLQLSVIGSPFYYISFFALRLGLCQFIWLLLLISFQIIKMQWTITVYVRLVLVGAYRYSSCLQRSTFILSFIFKELMFNLPLLPIFCLIRWLLFIFWRLLDVRSCFSLETLLKNRGEPFDRWPRSSIV